MSLVKSLMLGVIGLATQAFGPAPAVIMPRHMGKSALARRRDPRPLPKGRHGKLYYLKGIRP
jgi:hypothetical protein